MIGSLNVIVHLTLLTSALLESQQDKLSKH
jgi:hypothetical protein